MENVRRGIETARLRIYGYALYRRVVGETGVISLSLAHKAMKREKEKKRVHHTLDLLIDRVNRECQGSAEVHTPYMAPGFFSQLTRKGERT